MCTRATFVLPCRRHSPIAGQRTSKIFAFPRGHHIPLTRRCHLEPPVVGGDCGVAVDARLATIINRPLYLFSVQRRLSNRCRNLHLLSRPLAGRRRHRPCQTHRPSRPPAARTILLRLSREPYICVSAQGGTAWQRGHPTVGEGGDADVTTVIVPLYFRILRRLAAAVRVRRIVGLDGGCYVALLVFSAVRLGRQHQLFKLYIPFLHSHDPLCVR